MINYNNLSYKIAPKLRISMNTDKSYYSQIVYRTNMNHWQNNTKDQPIIIESYNPITKSISKNYYNKQTKYINCNPKLANKNKIIVNQTKS